jgi:REP element-mobilizing transposase RayT
MQLNEIGQIVHEEWLKTPLIRPEIELDGFVIMPNHLHGIIIINDHSVGTHRYASKEHRHAAEAHRDAPPNNQDGPSGLKGAGVGRTHSSASLQRKSGSLGSIIAGFKSAATTRINVLRKTPRLPVWQPKFHDHIIRDDEDLNRIREYILQNPIKWYYDEENPANRAAGKS